MLSNDVAEWSVFLRKKYNLDRLFDLTVISGEVGLRKPDKDIYVYLMQRINAKDCIFIDDREKNLLPAIELGISPIQFVRNPQTDFTLSNISRIRSFSELELLLL